MTIEEETILSNSKKFTKLRILKNAVVLSTGFVFFFTAYDALSMLQSTMNNAQGIGVASLAITYAGFSISALLLPKYVIQKLGCKTTLVMSMLFYVPYLASNYYPHWITMIPSAVLIGFAASLLWGSQCTYLNEISMQFAAISYKGTSGSREAYSNKISVFSTCTDEYYVKGSPARSQSLTCTDIVKDYSVKANIRSSSVDGLKNHLHSSSVSESKKNTKKYSEDSNISSDSYKQASLKLSFDDVVESTNARFFGVFGMAYLSTHALGNMMSYFVLKKTSSTNSNLSSIHNISCLCGAGFCNAELKCNNDNFEELSVDTRYILTSICVALSLLGVVLIALFMDNLETDKKSVTFSFDLLMATCKFTKKKEPILLIALAFYIGMIQGFYTGDFTKSFIACAWGTYHVGLVSICYGIASAIASTLSGYMVKLLGRLPVFLTAEMVNVAANVLLLVWQPDPNYPFMLFVAAGMWGVFTGTFWSQLRAFYGILFKADEEAAFAAFYLWYSLGYCLSFAYSNYLCVYVKIYILLAVSTLGMVGYLKVEISHLLNKRKT